MSVHLLLQNPPVSGTDLHAYSLEVSDDIVLDPITSTFRDNNITAMTGMMVYNSTVGGFQGYNGSWETFNTSSGPVVDSYFYARDTSGSAFAGPGAMLFNTVDTNIGSDFNGDTYTAPAAGYYQFNYSCGITGQINATGTTGIFVSALKNGTGSVEQNLVGLNIINGTGSNASAGANFKGGVMLRLAAGDTINMNIDYNGPNPTALVNNMFCGGLVRPV